MNSEEMTASALPADESAAPAPGPDLPRGRLGGRPRPLALRRLRPPLGRRCVLRFPRLPLRLRKRQPRPATSNTVGLDWHRFFRRDAMHQSSAGF